jgi:hypothetical protein
MKPSELAVLLEGRVVTTAPLRGGEIRGGYSSDLLSDVIANAQEGDVWITLQKHLNIAAVAHLKGLAAIVLVHDRCPDQDTIARADEDGVVIISTPLSAFDAAGLLYECGLRGRRGC